MKIEVLCATMHQKDLSKFYEMNIQTDVVYANQDDRHEYSEKKIGKSNVKMITTPYRGVGKNRNMAILYSSADILLFSDDDMVYVDNYSEEIITAFQRLTDADIIIFNIGSIGEQVDRRINQKIGKVSIYNVLNYGMPRIAVRRESIEKSNIWISTIFGGGAKYCGGEDNLFLVSALKKGLKIYTYPFCIGRVKTGNSTWFRGFNEKYYFDNGAWLEATFGGLKHLLVWYFILKFKDKTELNLMEILKIHYEGMKAFKKGSSYDEWKRKR